MGNDLFNGFVDDGGIGLNGINGILCISGFVGRGCSGYVWLEVDCVGFVGICYYCFGNINIISFYGYYYVLDVVVVYCDDWLWRGILFFFMVSFYIWIGIGRLVVGCYWFRCSCL